MKRGMMLWSVVMFSCIFLLTLTVVADGPRDRGRNRDSTSKYIKATGQIAQTRGTRKLLSQAEASKQMDRFNASISRMNRTNVTDLPKARVLDAATKMKIFGGIMGDQIMPKLQLNAILMEPVEDSVVLTPNNPVGRMKGFNGEISYINLGAEFTPEDPLSMAVENNAVLLGGQIIFSVYLVYKENGEDSFISPGKWKPDWYMITGQFTSANDNQDQKLVGHALTKSSSYTLEYPIPATPGLDIYVPLILEVKEGESPFVYFGFYGNKSDWPTVYFRGISIEKLK